MKAEITNYKSSFFEYLCGFIWFDQDRLEVLMKRYPIGATKQGEPIFWHINSEHKITNGRILTMDSETGKVYDDSWYYQDGRPTCLFGEQLLDIFPSQTLALVTDEMTAAIMSCFPPPTFGWLLEKRKRLPPICYRSQENLWSCFQTRVTTTNGKKRCKRFPISYFISLMGWRKCKAIATPLPRWFSVSNPCGRPRQKLL